MKHDDGSPLEPNALYVGDAVKLLGEAPGDFADLILTSPPYDDMRDYQGYSFEPASMLAACFRACKPGGVCVWVVGERIRDRQRTLTSFEHIFIGRDAGFAVFDVMIYAKSNTAFMRPKAYTNAYELMIVFSKGPPATFNPLKTERVNPERERRGTAIAGKGSDGVNHYVNITSNKEKARTNIWTYATGGIGCSATDYRAYQHPAIFPEKLAADHILSWTDKGMLVLDPMCGSGTTCKMAKWHERDYIGIDISQGYIDIARERLASELL